MKLNLSIKQRTILGFALMFLLVLIASGTGLGYSVSATRTVAVMHNGSKQIESITNLQMSWLTVVATIDNMLLTRQTNLIERRLNSELADFNQQLADLQTQTMGESPEMITQNQEIMGDLFSLGDGLIDTVNELNALVQEERWTQAQFLRHNNLASLQRRFGENLDWLRANIQNDVDASVTATVRSQNLFRTFWIFTTIVALGAGLLAAILITTSIVRPIAALVATATAIKGGNLSARAKVTGRDEIGVLADVFNTMTAQLRQTLEGLEERVKARTQQLETVATLSGQLNSILDFDRLLSELVTLTKETFNYYHVHIYLLDKENQTLALKAGYGQAGAEMKQRGHQIDLDAAASLVARAARNREVVQVDNVQQAPDWLPNPLLPDTCSEMAVPIIASEGVVGVLDVQSDRVAGLDRSDRDLLQSLANQMAVALTNAGLFQEVLEANTEIQTLNERLKSENLRMEAELDVTRRLQQMLLPGQEELAQVDGLDIAGFMQPAAEVGGDYYDVLRHGGRVKIGIGDVTGHGLESGVVMLMAQTAVRTLLTSGVFDPVRFMDILNRVLFANLRRMNVSKTMSLVLLDYEQDKARVNLSGQHEQVLIVRQNGQVEVKNTMELGFPVGLVENISGFVGESNITLMPGDGVVLFSDGFTEAENVAGEFYGLERLCRVVSRHWREPVETIKEAVVADAHQFIGQRVVYDDLALLVIKQKQEA